MTEWLNHIPLIWFQSPWFLLHITSVILADFFLFVGACVAVLYLIQDRRLKRKQFEIGFFSRRIPPVDSLDEVGIKLIGLAFVLMTLGVLSGSFLAWRFWGPLWYLDPRQLVSVCVWFIFAGVLLARLSTGWRGRRAAWVTLIGLLLTLLGMFGVENLSNTKHQDKYADVFYDT